MKELHNSQYRLRKTIGILGIALPLLLLVNHENLLASMSHYYYTSASIFFIGILIAFGLILFTYEGYPLDPSRKERLSDDSATTLAAICIFITVLIPTTWDGAMGQIHFKNNTHYLFGHANPIKGTIHLASAGLFLILLGYMCFAKFTMSKKITAARKRFYQICGIAIWSSVAILIILFIIDSKLIDDKLNSYFPAYTFWFETIAVWAFGIAWLVKGKFEKDLVSISRKIKRKLN